MQDQNLKGIIKVKAIDKAGNERIVEVKTPFSSKKNLGEILVLIILGLLIVGSAVWIIIVRRQSKRYLNS